MDRGKAPGITTLAAALVAVLAFVLYRSTLLPGLDFGDTPSFQVMAGSLVITPRDGYPLYFAIGRLFVWVLPGDQAHALNVASAVHGALTCAVVLLLATQLAGSLLAGTAAAILFGGSYTFWSQSVIAEVYSLHILLVGLTTLLLLRWGHEPTAARLGAFVAAYALAFGNHLTMILLAPAYLLFLVLTSRQIGAPLVTTRTMVMTIVLTVAGALQYLWNFRALALRPLPPASLADALNAFWFDVTKADWRESMVAQVPTAVAGERLWMFVFDVRQQIGWPGIALAVVGLLYLLRTNLRRGLLLLVAYVSTAAFAVTYSVGDSHVFFLTPHVIMALLTAPGLVLIARVAPWRAALPVAAALVVTYGLVRVHEDYPALDRSADRRPRELLDAFTAGIDDRSAVLLTDLNWQVENGLNYYQREVRPEIATVPFQAVASRAAALVRDNAAIGRDILVSERVRAELARAHGNTLSSSLDGRMTTPTIADLVARLPAGTRYALCVLKPTRDQTIDADDLSTAVRLLTGNHLNALDGTRYTAIAGLVGSAPVLSESHDAPWRRTVDVGNVPVTVRMDAWLGFDTIRRMGFGHVIVNRHHTLIVDRGVSFAAFDDSGRPTVSGYAANIFAPKARYLVRALPQ